MRITLGEDFLRRAKEVGSPAVDALALPCDEPIEDTAMKSLVEKSNKIESILRDAGFTLSHNGGCGFTVTPIEHSYSISQVFMDST